MKKVEIELTAKEIEALQISICAAKIGLEHEIDNLIEHDKSGNNEESIRIKAERIQDLVALFEKLYQAEKLLEV